MPKKNMLVVFSHGKESGPLGSKIGVISVYVQILTVAKKGLPCNTLCKTAKMGRIDAKT